MSAEPIDLLAGLRSGDWLDAQTFPPLIWAVPGLFCEGMSLLVGPPKAGKSWLSLDIALAVATGGRALGQIAVGAPRPVLLLALEDGDRRMQHRCRELLHGAPIPAGLHYMTRIESSQIVATIRAWLDTLHSFTDPLIVLDTLGKVMPRSLPGETDYQRDYRTAGDLKRLCDERPGMSLLVLHHDRKAAADDFVQAVSGTNGVAGAADSIVILSRPRTESNGLLKVTGRDVEEAEYAVTITDGHWTLDGESLAVAAQRARAAKEASRLGEDSAAILAYVNDHPNGVRAADVAEAIGMEAKQAGTYLGRLAKAGSITKAERGLYVPVNRVESVEMWNTDPSDSHTPTHSTRFPLGRTACGSQLHPIVAAEGATTGPSCDGVDQ